MEITINQKEFQKAVDELFSKYGVTTSEIIDFTEGPVGITFKVNKTVDSEVKLNAEIDDLIKSNNFKSTNIAFICSDGKIHSSSQTTLFDRVKEFVSNDLIPICGFDSLITASELVDELDEKLSNGPVVYNKSVFTKEGTQLRCSRLQNSSVEGKQLVKYTITSDAPNLESRFDKLIKFNESRNAFNISKPQGSITVLSTAQVEDLLFLIEILYGLDYKITPLK